MTQVKQMRVTTTELNNNKKCNHYETKKPNNSPGGEK